MQIFVRAIHSSIVKFVARTLFYFVILVMLLYLYGYSGINDGGFIYNEF
ncbi:teichoic acid D-Ala incorporation-associated protein DltX [Oenococcus sicerae]|uniref:Teichoic acid D-Ala incorporation-associated protein DltX n=1 Tax=Oenococcus sicerae TaxID=2203724 RepID=A0AAJ1R9J9_9LACO|nr:teichoic acid D-Ala incorporation-associated protein DltX [Oenococcus sicerae]MDN6900256.1 teichoic acid D-Ala incorporation-associated protein DltX [Oenococcus sicerae]QAS69833.1 teichoic acid D-Ala incorporation-associated protein DltX [Oenococcus sicerae]